MAFVFKKTHLDEIVQTLYDSLELLEQLSTTYAPVNDIKYWRKKNKHT